MITSGLVITLNADPALATQARAALQARPEFTLGKLNARWLPAALEAADVGASRDVHDWLNTVPGVDFVDVVQVNFEEEDDSTAEKVEFVVSSTAGAAERSPQRKLWDQRKESKAPEGRKQRTLEADEPVAPPGLVPASSCTHGSRRGLLSAAAPQLEIDFPRPMNSNPPR
jgi:hypothetical protein